MRADYEKVAQSFEGEDSVVIANVDADSHKELGSKYGVTGYPTIQVFPQEQQGSATPHSSHTPHHAPYLLTPPLLVSAAVLCSAGEDYNGGRTPEDFVAFINERAGISRQVGGGFPESAGRVAAFSELVKRFVKADTSEKSAILTEALGLEESSSAHGKNYIAAFKKIVEGKVDYVKSEIARLTKMATGANLKPKDKANFHKRINVLKEFE